MRLSVEQISAGYGAGTVIHGVEVCVPAGTVHAVVGHNGAGKTSLLHTIAGLIPARRGRIRLGDTDITALPTHRRSRAGVGYVPQGRRVFASLTVTEHLAIAERRTTEPVWTRDRVLALLPQLAARARHRGTHLSGGEQQMLAIARALLTQPALLLLDEPTEGLAPTLAEQIRHTITTLAAEGIGVLLATPQPDLAAAVADHVSVLTAGRITARFDSVGGGLDQLRAALTPDTTGGLPAGVPPRDRGQPPEPAAWIDLTTTSSAIPATGGTP